MAWTDYYLDLAAGSNGAGTSTGSPWNTYANAISGLTTAFGGSTATAPTRINVKGDGGTLAGTVTFSLIGTSAFPILWRGCDASWVAIEGTASDYSITKPKLTLSGAANLFSCSGAYNLFSALHFISAYTSTALSTFHFTGANCQLSRCRLENTAAAANAAAISTSTGGTNLGVAGCLIAATASATQAASIAASGPLVVGNHIRGGLTQLLFSSTNGQIVGNTTEALSGATGDGINVSSASGNLMLVSGNTVYRPGRDGIRFANSNVRAVNNLIHTVGSSNYAINFTGTAAVLIVGGNAWYGVAGTALNGIIENFAALQPGALGSDPLPNAASGDFRDASALLNTGVPGGFEAQSYASNIGPGSAMPANTGGGTGVSYGRVVGGY